MTALLTISDGYSTQKSDFWVTEINPRNGLNKNWKWFFIILSHIFAISDDFSKFFSTLGMHELHFEKSSNLEEMTKNPFSTQIFRISGITDPPSLASIAIHFTLFYFPYDAIHAINCWKNKFSNYFLIKSGFWPFGTYVSRTNFVLLLLHTYTYPPDKTFFNKRAFLTFWQSRPALNRMNQALCGIVMIKSSFCSTHL